MSGEDLADRILDSAGELFLRRGVEKAGMGEVAEGAGISRATLYRYFDDRRALQRAYVHRRTRQVAAAVAAEVDGMADRTDRLVAAIMSSVRRVRAEPTLRVWFTAANLDITRDLISSSSVIDEVAAVFLGPAAGTGEGEWLIRTVVGLLLLPGPDEGREEEMLRRFVAPQIGVG